MKVRSQRTHFMGTSNRQDKFLISKKSDLFHVSHVRSSSFYQSAKSNSAYKQQRQLKLRKLNDPFRGTHSQFESLRLNKNTKRRQRQNSQSLSLMPIQFITIPKLNQRIKQIKNQFNQKQVNMHKLNELKHIFIKNNTLKRNLKDYYNKFAVLNTGINKEGLKNIVKQYGYNINDDQADIMIKLNRIHNKGRSTQKESNLELSQFINLMTKQNVYFDTLTLNKPNNKNPKQIYRFSQSQFQIFRNKFHKLKQALNIYKGQQINKKKFDNVMKKLDLNDLIISQQQKDKIFSIFSVNQSLNSQKFLGSIAAQQHQRIQKSGNINLDSSFMDQIKLNKQYKFQKMPSLPQFDLKRASVLQFQNKLESAQKIVNQLKIINNQGKQICNQLCKNKKFTTKKQLRQTVQQVLQKQGLNFSQEEYSSFISFLNYDNKNIVSVDQLNKFIIKDQKIQILDRLDRRKRKLPLHLLQKQQNQKYNYQMALQTLNKIKQQKMNPESTKMFKDLDSDNDGYLGYEQLQAKLQQFNLDKVQINNLVNYMKINNQASLNLSDFNSKFSPSQESQQSFSTRFIKSKSSLDWNNHKKNMIKEENICGYMIPTKFSAWPANLYQSDLSLIQVPRKSGMHIQEKQRFNIEQRNTLGLTTKQEKNKLYQNKLKRIAKWNNIVHERAELKQKQCEQKNIAKTYNLRLLKQNYEAVCHGRISEY